MITQKHGRKLASQLGEVLFVCQFYDLQIVKKISLSLRNLWLHLVQMCVCPSSPQRHYIRNISSRTTTTCCFPQATVSDVNKELRNILMKHKTAN